MRGITAGRTLPGMRVLPLTAVALAAALALSACGGPSGAGTSDPTAPVPASPAATAGTPAVAQLMGGFWRVRDAAGEPADSWLRLTPLSITLFRPGGRIDGALAAQADHLLADQSGWSMSLGDDHEAPWLAAADRVERDGEGWVLLDVDGSPVARLVRDGRPARSTQYETEPDGLVGSPRRLRSAVPGDGVVDAPASALAGTWHLAGHREAAVAFRADGRWSATTSCASGTGANGGGGRYRVLPGGMLLTTQLASTAMGCSGATGPVSADAPAVLGTAEARSFRIDGDRLTLFDAEGAAIGSLVR